MDIMVLLGQMLVLFVMIGIGFYIYRNKWVNDESAAHISRIVVNIFNPMLVLSAVMNDSVDIDATKLMTNLKLVVFYYILSILFSFVIAWILRPKKELWTIYRLMAIFSNLGFMGIPVAKGLYGDEAVVYVSFYVLFYNLLIYTYGMFLCKRAGKENHVEHAAKTSTLETLRKIMNPGVIAGILAIVIMVSKISMPAPVVTFCKYMGDTTIPLSMLMIGISVAKADLKRYLKDARIYAFIFLRMLLLPIVTACVLRQFALDSVVLGVLIVEMGMPVGSIVGLIAGQCGGDADYCMKGTVITTLASIVTLPIVGLFL